MRYARPNQKNRIAKTSAAWLAFDGNCRSARTANVKIVQGVRLNEAIDVTERSYESAKIEEEARGY